MGQLRFGRLAYLGTAFFGKFLKSAPEILFYTFMDSATYVAFVVLLNQSQIATNWILGGFGSAGYKIYGRFPDRRLFWRSMFLIAINFLIVAAATSGIKLFWPEAIKGAAIAAGAGFACLTSAAVYLRAREKLMISVWCLEIIPYALMSGLLLWGLSYSDWPVGFWFTGAVLAAAGCALVIILRDPANGRIPENSFLRGFYRKSLPFFLVSGVNVVLSRADTTLLQQFASADVLAEYILSSRFAAFLMTVSYIFQHLHLPQMVAAWHAEEHMTLLRIIVNYMRETFGVAALSFLVIFGAAYSGLLAQAGFDVNLVILGICGLLTLGIIPLTIFSYLLILAQKTRQVVGITLLGFFATLLALVVLRTQLNGVSIALVFLGAVLCIKLFEALYFIRLIKKQTCNRRPDRCK